MVVRGCGGHRQEAEQRLRLAGSALDMSCGAPCWATASVCQALLAELRMPASAPVLPALADLLELPNNKHAQTAKDYNLMQKYFAAMGYSASDYYYL